MKRLLALGLAVVSTGALASKARLEALGESGRGSLYIDDARNFVLNPATLNNHKDYATIEMGQNVAEDASTTPRAEGGVFMASGNMTYGVYFGEESNQGNELRTNAGAKLPGENNNVAFAIAGDAGVQWGATILYGTTKADVDGDADGSISSANDSKSESSVAKAKFGVLLGNTDVSLGLGLINEATFKTGDSSVDQEYKGEGSYELYVSHRMGNLTLMGEYVSFSGKDEKTAGSKAEKTTQMGLGLGSVRKLNDKSSLVYKVAYKSSTVEAPGYSATAKDKEQTSLKATVGFEAQAKEWLVLRGSISQEILGVGTTKSGTTEYTNGQAVGSATESAATIMTGASLVFGDVSIDGYLGTTNGTSAVQGEDVNEGVLRTDRLLSRVSMTYKF